MSAQAHRFPLSPPDPVPLRGVVDRAGALRVPRGGSLLVASHGSVVAELSACVSAVGLSDCSHLLTLVLEGEGRPLRALVAEMTGLELRPGGVARAAGAWWCAETAGRVIVVGEPAAAERLRSAVAARVARRLRVTVTDRSGDWAALTVVGRRTVPLLARLGVYGEAGDPRAVPPLRHHPVDGHDAVWLLQSDRRALAIVSRLQAGSLWRAIMDAGRDLGITAVGQDAVDRYALLAGPLP